MTSLSLEAILLLATKLAAQIKKNVDEAAELEWEWLLRKMMESPTVSSLALALSSTEEAEKAAPKGRWRLLSY